MLFQSCNLEICCIIITIQNLIIQQYLLMDINAFQSNLFTRCTTCDKLDRELHKQLNPEKKRDIFIKKQEHLHRQMYVSTSYLHVALIT